MKTTFFSTIAAVIGWKHPWLQAPAAILGAAIAFLFGGWSTLLGILLTLVILDYITGILAAGHRGQLSSAIGFRGIGLKITIFVMVAVAHQVDRAFGDPGVIMNAVIFFYLANELLSIVENAGELGLPIPGALARAVEMLKGKSEVE